MPLWPRGALDAGEFVLDEMGLEVARDRALESARKLTGGRCATVYVLSDCGLAVFTLAGIDDDLRAGIAKFACRRGVLGDLILDLVQLRLADVGQNPRFDGMPPGVPTTRPRSGAPILVDRVPDRSLYLTAEGGGRLFTDEDLESIVAPAGFAGRAIERDRRQGNGGALIGGVSDR
jgi:hypothetical protein